jgi:hypothetical protein
MPITKDNYISLLASFIVLRVLLLKEYLQKAFINSPLFKARLSLLILVYFLFLPPIYI